MFAHVPISIGIQFACLIIGYYLGAPVLASVWTGCFAGSAICIMREITQYEYQWIERYGEGRRANLPRYAGLQVWRWNAHSILETIMAIFAPIVIAALVSHVVRG